MPDRTHLRPNENKQGGHLVVNLKAGEVTSGAVVTEVPSPSLVEDKVEQMALSKGKTDMHFHDGNRIEFPNGNDALGLIAP